MTMTSVFAPIFKREEQADGTLMIYGKATGSDLDLDNQRCDPDWLKRAVPKWFGTGRIGDVGGNIRMQHDPNSAVGKAHEHEVHDDGHYIRAHIVDPLAVIKTKAGVFTGLSIGISKPILDKTKNGEWIKGGDICEVSICDRPCLPTATFTMCKTAKPGMQMNASDFDSTRMLVRVEELVEKTVEPDLYKTAEPEMTVKLSDSVAPEQAAKLESIINDARSGTVTPDAQNDTGESTSTGNATGFDRAAAKALVAATLTKATDADMPPAYDEEAGDIQNAQAAIAIIAKLIVSEASELADNPAEAFDISLLLESLSALRCFIGREQNQQLGDDNADVPTLMFGTGDPDLVKAKYDAAQLQQMLKAGKAFKNPDGDPSYPIGDKEDLSNAIRAVGRGSGDHDGIRAYITRRAAALGASSMIPDNWTSSGSNTGSDKSVGAEVEKAVEVVEKTYTLNEARTELGLPPDNSEVGDIVKVASESDVKTTDPVVEKAATEDPDTLVKALTSALEKTDNPLRQLFLDIAEAASAKSVAEAFTDVGARLEKVEAMATPGGPALRRTEIERTEARKSDLTSEALRFTALANTTEDHVLRKGYAAKAAQLDAEIKAL